MEGYARKWDGWERAQLFVLRLLSQRKIRAHVGQPDYRPEKGEGGGGGAASCKSLGPNDKLKSGLQLRLPRMKDF
jgi:hypothetical protein